MDNERIKQDIDFTNNRLEEAIIAIKKVQKDNEKLILNDGLENKIVLCEMYIKSLESTSNIINESIQIFYDLINDCYKEITKNNNKLIDDF